MLFLLQIFLNQLQAKLVEIFIAFPIIRLILLKQGVSYLEPLIDYDLFNSLE